MTRIGLALGGGGAKGLAHICMLEVIDEFGLKPSRIVGTSIGAIIGVMYASGISGRTLREEFQNISNEESSGFIEAMRNIFTWLQLTNVNWKGGSLLKADAALDDLMRYVQVANFEDLSIPVQVVASDFWRRTEVVLESGTIRSGVHASIALPGVLEPAVVDGRVLVDGGLTNPVPYDLVMDDCDITIAIDVLGSRTESKDLIPSLQESVFNSFQIMQKSILRQKMEARPPDIYICPNLVDVLLLEFYEAPKIFAQAAPAADQLRRELERCLQEANRQS